MGGWDFDSNDQGKKVEFTKFPEGITRIRVVDAEPFVRWTHFLPKFTRSINCPGKGCPICEIRRQQKANKEPYSYQMTRRFAMNVINRETGKLEIMEQGKTFFEDLRDVMQTVTTDDKGDPTGKTLIDVDVKVKRRGTGKDNTSYRLDIGDESEISNQDKVLMEGKINLAEYFKPHTNEQILRIVQGEAWDEVMKSETPDEESSEEIELR